MKIIHLMRHAKAEEDRGQEDKLRQLTDRGVRAAGLMGIYFSQQNIKPGIVLCSDAVRTRETYEHIKAYLPDVPVQFDGALYHAVPSTIVDQISQLPDKYDSVLIVGHNPGIHELAARLAREGSEKLIDRISQGYPTATVASFDVAIDSWSDLSLHSKARIVRYESPDDLV